MVGAAGGIETGVVPVGVVTEPERWHARGHKAQGFRGSRAAEGPLVELIPLLVREIGTLRPGRDFVETGFVVVVAQQIRL